MAGSKAALHVLQLLPQHAAEETRTAVPAAHALCASCTDPCAPHQPMTFSCCPLMLARQFLLHSLLFGSKLCTT